MIDPNEVKKEIQLQFVSIIQDKKEYESYDDLIAAAKDEAENYIRKRGGIQRIILDREVLDEAYERVRQIFDRTKNFEYFKRRELVIPELNRFYTIINRLLSHENSSCEYIEYLKKIMLDASKGTWYPYLNEIEHQIPKQEPQQTLDILVQQARKRICARVGARKWFFYSQCKVCQKYLNDKLKGNKSIRNIPFDTQKNLGFPFYQHAFNIVQIDGKEFIIDPTYIQFCDLRSTKDVTKVPGYMGAVPGQYLMDGEEKQYFLHNLIKYGFFEITEKNLKMYFDSFVLANRGNSYYKLHPKASKMETEFNGRDYLDMLLGKKILNITESVQENEKEK